MLAKLTAKNQITLPKNITQTIGPVEYVEVTLEGSQMILTPVKMQRANAVCAKLAELEISEQGIVDTVAWAPPSTNIPHR